VVGGSAGRALLCRKTSCVDLRRSLPKRLAAGCRWLRASS
jgi:hypothetical protein